MESSSDWSLYKGLGVLAQIPPTSWVAIVLAVAIAGAVFVRFIHPPITLEHLTDRLLPDLRIRILRSTNTPSTTKIRKDLCYHITRRPSQQNARAPLLARCSRREERASTGRKGHSGRSIPSGGRRDLHERRCASIQRAGATERYARGSSRVPLLCVPERRERKHSSEWISDRLEKKSRLGDLDCVRWIKGSNGGCCTELCERASAGHQPCYTCGPVDQ